MDFKLSDLVNSWAYDNNLYVEHFDSIESTNEYAKKKLYKNQSLIFSDFQTKGKGRGKIWTSPAKGTSFQGSFIFNSKNPVYPSLSMKVGRKLHQAFCTTWPKYAKNFSIKEPNDIYYEKLKIAGILIENINFKEINQIIIGMGINIFEKPENIINAGCLADYIQDISYEKLKSFLTLLKNGLDELLYVRLGNGTNRNT